MVCDTVVPVSRVFVTGKFLDVAVSRVFGLRSQG